MKHLKLIIIFLSATLALGLAIPLASFAASPTLAKLNLLGL